MWVGDLREELGEETAFEWFQWLAERLEQYNVDDGKAAYRLHAGWTPSHVRQEL